MCTLLAAGRVLQSQTRPDSYHCHTRQSSSGSGAGQPIEGVAPRSHGGAFTGGRIDLVVSPHAGTGMLTEVVALCMSCSGLTKEVRALSADGGCTSHFVAEVQVGCGAGGTFEPLVCALVRARLLGVVL